MECPQTGWRCGIENKAAFALQSKSNVKLIAALLFVLSRRLSWGDYQFWLCTLPLAPSISFFLAGDEYGSCLSSSQATTNRLAASSTLVKAGGISCLRILSVAVSHVSLPTWEVGMKENVFIPQPGNVFAPARCLTNKKVNSYEYVLLLDSYRNEWSMIR